MGEGVSGSAEAGNIRVLITNYRSHPASTWAEVSADSILELISIESSSLTAIRAQTEKDRLRDSLVKLFADEYQNVQHQEQATVIGEFDPFLFMPAILHRLYGAIEETPFANHFSQSNVKGVVRNILHKRIGGIMNVERSYRGSN